ncbi:MAG: CPBP family intramembrane metalloprotease [candidate division WOR-3 bacterium]|nr:MAG: CPBP family intramembrane metalloprotease [candidate division WOR-3 bacterium]
MLKVLKAYLDEIAKIDRESALIIVYSTSILLFAMFMKRTHFLMPREVFLERLLVVGTLYGLSPFVLFLAFKRAPKDYGIGIGDPRSWLKDVIFLYLLFLVLLVIAFKFIGLKGVYPLSRRAGQSIGYFVIYQAVQLWYMVGWEFFFRGFMLFGLERKFGRLSILIQAMAFGLAHFKKPQLEAYGAVIAGLFLGVLALRSRSFVPCIMLHYMVVLTADGLGIIL